MPKKLTQKEIERRDRFWVYADFGHADMEEMRRLYFEQHGEPVDIAEQFDTDLGTVFRVITGADVAWRRKRGTIRIDSETSGSTPQE